MESKTAEKRLNANIQGINRYRIATEKHLVL